MKLTMTKYSHIDYHSRGTAVMREVAGYYDSFACRYTDVDVYCFIKPIDYNLSVGNLASKYEMSKPVAIKVREDIRIASFSFRFRKGKLTIKEIDENFHYLNVKTDVFSYKIPVWFYKKYKDDYLFDTEQIIRSYADRVSHLVHLFDDDMKKYYLKKIYG